MAQAPYETSAPTPQTEIPVDPMVLDFRQAMSDARNSMYAAAPYYEAVDLKDRFIGSVHENRGKIVAVGVACVVGASAAAASGQTEASDSSSTAESQYIQAQRSLCSDALGLQAVKAIKGATFRINSKGSKVASIRDYTYDASECDKFGQRTIKSITLKTKGSAHKNWKTSENLLGPVTTNDSTKINKRVNLNNKCLAGDKAILVRYEATTSYLDYKSNKAHANTQFTRIQDALKVPCK